MENYKGMCMYDRNKNKYYEGGAHFKYIALYNILVKISSIQKLKLRTEELIRNKIKRNKKRNINSTRQKNSQNNNNSIKFNVSAYY